MAISAITNPQMVMNKLNLAPLPTVRDDETQGLRSAEMDGFVDEAIVQSIMAGPSVQRSHAARQDLILTADDNDFAGWQHTAPSPFRKMVEQAEPATAPLKLNSSRRALPPAYLESGIGTPHTGAHRWWVAGIGGALTTLLLSYLLLTLAHRPMPENPMDLNPSTGTAITSQQMPHAVPAEFPAIENVTTSLDPH